MLFKIVASPNEPATLAASQLSPVIINAVEPARTANNETIAITNRETIATILIQVCPSPIFR